MAPVALSTATPAGADTSPASAPEPAKLKENLWPTTAEAGAVATASAPRIAETGARATRRAGTLDECPRVPLESRRALSIAEQPVLGHSLWALRSVGFTLSPWSWLCDSVVCGACTIAGLAGPVHALVHVRTSATSHARLAGEHTESPRQGGLPVHTLEGTGEPCEPQAHQRLVPLHSSSYPLLHCLRHESRWRP